MKMETLLKIATIIKIKKTKKLIKITKLTCIIIINISNTRSLGINMNIQKNSVFPTNRLKYLKKEIFFKHFDKKHNIITII